MAYGVVYGLYDPLTDELRYIGQTIVPLEVRLRGHMAAVNLKAKRHASHWLRELKNKGLAPLIKPLREAGSEEELDALEIQMIATERERGARLTNHSPGGTGGGRRGLPGVTISAEGKKKISEAQRGRERTPEARARMSEALSGRTMSIEQRKKLSASLSGRSLSDSHKQRLSEVAREISHGPMPEKTKAKIASALRGRRTNTAEHMAKLVEIHLGAKRSAEARQRMSEAAKNRPRKVVANG
jgi:hypothetical protein